MSCDTRVAALVSHWCRSVFVINYTGIIETVRQDMKNGGPGVEAATPVAAEQEPLTKNGPLEDKFANDELKKAHKNDDESSERFQVTYNFVVGPASAKGAPRERNQSNRGHHARPKRARTLHADRRASHERGGPK